MQRALALARQALWLTSPNPRVGCVITAADGTVLGEGHTQRAGGPHAEVVALRDAAARGHSVQGATAWVTLEPCAHQGRTGPCCDALAATGIGRVVSAMTDPNPKVAGQGMARLAAAGVQTDTLPPASDIAVQARELNIGFFSRMERGLPWVRMKIAASLDGQTSLQNGQSQWITSEPARSDGHAWRARACAVLTGIGTVLEDNPRLDVRGHDTPRQPHLVIVDSRLETPLGARLFETLGQGDQVFNGKQHDERADPQRRRERLEVGQSGDDGREAPEHVAGPAGHAQQAGDLAEDDEQDADDGQHPRPGADHPGVSVGLDEAEKAVLPQQLAQLEADAGHYASPPLAGPSVAGRPRALSYTLW